MSGDTLLTTPPSPHPLRTTRALLPTPSVPLRSTSILLLTSRPARPTRLPPRRQLVYYGKLASSDGSVRHCGDQRSGAAAGDDEQIVLSLAHVHPAVTAIGIVINSYSGQAAAVAAVGVAVAAVGAAAVRVVVSPKTRPARSSTTSRAARATSSTPPPAATSPATRSRVSASSTRRPRCSWRACTATPHRATGRCAS